MSLIKLVEPAEATGKVAEIYQNMINAMGFVPNAFKLFRTSEHLLGQHVGNLNYFMRHNRLGGKLLSFIRLLVSEEVQCSYCIGMNTQILFQYGVLPEMVAEIRLDPTKVPLEDNEKALLMFVLKVVKNSNSTVQEDIDKLHDLGWTDAEILEGTYHGASTIATDMIFNAFKVDIDG